MKTITGRIRNYTPEMQMLESEASRMWRKKLRDILQQPVSGRMPSTEPNQGNGPHPLWLGVDFGDLELRTLAAHTIHDSIMVEIPEKEMRVMEDGRVLPDYVEPTHKVQIRDTETKIEGPVWNWDIDGPESWLGPWLDLSIDGSEDYCRGYCDGAGRYCDYAYYYRTVPVDTPGG